MITQPTIDSLLWAILEEPDRDDVRLVYADAIDEAGEIERAAYIRERVLEPYGQLHCTLDGAIGIAESWRSPEKRRFLNASGTVHRGFVVGVEMSCEDFLKHAETLFSEQPITEVRLTDKKPMRLQNRRTRGKEVWRWLIGGNQRHYWTGDILPLYIGMKLPGLRFNERGAHKEPRHDSEEAAFWALSVACVAWGRELVGLPPIKPPQVGG
jgi:uncharacterized protein (TIGR02996 family)